MSTVSSIAEHIVITPGTCGGKPRIAGHRITVQNIVICHEQMGMSPEQIVEDYETISLADVHAALVYYYDHRDEILADIRRDDEIMKEIEASQPSLLERIKREKPELYQRAVERLRGESFPET
ncbi:DUF433 domain-containing protein [Tautonia rosea]|uniref:DUF433 domain-containing protein n=1 Tax=Tautonia rosea TaxID=2728037 RepID=UPI0014750069|nr:DUF433 domain-containing protein [Tautonia rosea]